MLHASLTVSGLIIFWMDKSIKCQTLKKGEVQIDWNVYTALSH